MPCCCCCCRRQCMPWRQQAREPRAPTAGGAVGGGGTWRRRRQKGAGPARRCAMIGREGKLRGVLRRPPGAMDSLNAWTVHRCPLKPAHSLHGQRGGRARALSSSSHQPGWHSRLHSRGAAWGLLLLFYRVTGTCICRSVTVQAAIRSRTRICNPFRRVTSQGRQRRRPLSPPFCWVSLARAELPSPRRLRQPEAPLPAAAAPDTLPPTWDKYQCSCIAQTSHVSCRMQGFAVC